MVARVSQAQVRKPWGGQLDATRSRKPPERAPDFMDAFAPYIRRFCELSLLATLLAVPLMYQLSLTEGPYVWVREVILRFCIGVLGMAQEEAAVFFDDEMQPFFTGELPILSTKFSAWCIGGAVLIGGYVALRVAEAFTRRDVLPPTEKLPRFSSRNAHRTVPLVGMVLFLVLALASILFWSPAVPPDATLGSVSRLGGGGFLYSMESWFQILFAVVFFVACEEIIRDRAFVNKILGIIVFVGFLNAVAVVLLKIGNNPLVDIWIKFRPGEFRNSLGAFIGHNTGMSSFLMAPLLICLCWLIGVQPKSRPVFRFSLGMLVALFALAIILGQSRAVVPIIGAAVVAMWIFFYRRSCLAPFSRGLIWLCVALALVVSTQFVRSSYNPLYRQDISLVDRVSQFRYSHLRTETRLRILWVGMTQLVPARPLFGHGFASFQYVYPKAAGDFFGEYPETELAPTALRTPQAHNEYLQVLVENGIVGLLIVLVGIFSLLRGGYSVMQRTIMPYHITIQVAIFLSICALLIHCIFDFPLRIPPLALTLIVMAAIWSAGDRVWLFPLRPPEQDETPAGQEKKSGDKDGDTAEVVGGTPPTMVLPPWRLAMALAISSLVLMGGAALGFVASAPMQSAATSALRANIQIDRWAQTHDQGYLNSALVQANNARRVFWISGEANLVMAQAQFHRALFHLDLSRKEMDAGNPDAANQGVNLAKTYFEAALSDISLSLTELKFHGQYQLRSTIYGQLARFVPANMAGELRRRAVEDLQEASTINPGDPRVLLDLIRVLETNQDVNRQEIIRHMKVLNYFHPDFFRENIYRRMLDAAAVHDTAEARRILEILKECVEPGFRTIVRGEKAPLESGPLSPGALSPRRLRILAANDDIRLAEAHILFLEGQYDAAWDVASQYLLWHDQVILTRRSAFSEEQWAENDLLALTAQIIQLQDSVVKGKTVVSQRLLANLAVGNMADDPTLGAIRLLLAKLREASLDSGGWEVLEANMKKRTRENPYRARVVADQAEKAFLNLEEALHWMEIRRAITETPLDAVECAALARLYEKLGRWKELEDFLPTLESVRGTQELRTFCQRKAQEYRTTIAAMRAEGKLE